MYTIIFYDLETKKIETFQIVNLHKNNINGIKLLNKYEIRKCCVSCKKKRKHHIIKHNKASKINEIYCTYCFMILKINRYNKKINEKLYLFKFLLIKFFNNSENFLI